MKIKAIIWMFYKSLPRPIQETILSFLEFSRLITALPIFSLIFPFPCRNRIEDISKFDRRVFSQNGEDGIIEMLFRKIGTTNKYLVEFGAQDREYNGRFLVQIRGWCGLIMDCEKRKDSKIKKEKITAENVNAIFKKYEVPENFDLLSIDIDSNDYWVWKALGNYHPRAVVIEYNADLGFSKSVTVKYDPDFSWDGSNYFGASLLALTKLAESQGYSLVGCDKSGSNAFFVLTDLYRAKFAPRPFPDLYKPPRYGKLADGKFLGHPDGAGIFVTIE